MPGAVVDEGPVEPDEALVDREQPGERAQQRGLPRAVRAEDRDASRRRRRASSTSSAKVPSWRATRRGQAHPTPSQRSRKSARTATHTARSTTLRPDRDLGIRLEEDVDRERCGLGAALDVAGERDRRTELAEGACPRQRGAGDQAGHDHRQGHAPGHGHRSGAERCGGVLEAPVHRAQRGFDRDDEERHRDERLGHDDRGRRVGELDVEPAVQVLADQPLEAERVEEADAADDGRHHQRQEHDRPARSSGPGTRPGPAPRRAVRRSTTESAVAHSEQITESRSAAVDSGVFRSVQRSPHGTCWTSPMIGSAMNANPTKATSTADHGTRRPRRLTSAGGTRTTSSVA